jgi:tRNA A-37 threonylcarbamoyl transferase component Bud32
MPSLEVNPRYCGLLARLGLEAPGDFLALPGVVYCGHPDRHVARVALGEERRGFLKREHRVRWKGRLANAFAGFGYTSKSRREYRLLQEVAAAGIGCPEPIAAGEDGRGRAFLLLRELGGRDLRAFLRRAGPAARREVAVRLGEALAHIHGAGFDHPDLYSKHVLVRCRAGDGLSFHFLDWQRSRRRRRVGWAVRRRDLAALDATLAEDLAAPRERLACLRAYLRAAGRGAALPGLAAAARAVRRRSAALLRKRRMRELRQPPLEWGRQNLVWVQGEALCVTREFRAELGGRLPDWLTCGGIPPALGAHVSRSTVGLPRGPALLVRRRSCRPLAWLWAWLRGRRLLSPELEQAGTLFRLQRYGITTPRLLAVGQRHLRPWRAESLLLTEPPAGGVPLATWLSGQADREQRRLVLRRAAELLRRLHDADCSFRPGASPAEAVQVREGDTPEVVLGSVEGVRKRCSRGAVTRDLAALCRGLAGGLRRTEWLWFLLGYLELPRLTLAARRLARKLLGPSARAPG